LSSSLLPPCLLLSNKHLTTHRRPPCPNNLMPTLFGVQRTEPASIRRINMVSAMVDNDTSMSICFVIVWYFNLNVAYCFDESIMSPRSSYLYSSPCVERVASTRCTPLWDRKEVCGTTGSVQAPECKRICHAGEQSNLVNWDAARFLYTTVLLLLSCCCCCGVSLLRRCCCCCAECCQVCRHQTWVMVALV
jgi:hypothetical protein